MGGRFLCHIVSYCICYVKSAILNNLCVVSSCCGTFYFAPFVQNIIFFFNIMSYSNCLAIPVLWKLHWI